MSSTSRSMTSILRAFSSLSTPSTTSSLSTSSLERIASSLRTSTSSWHSLNQCMGLHIGALSQRQISPLQSMVPAAPTATTGKGLAPRPIFDLSPRELENVLIERPLWAEARWRRAPTSAKKLRVPVNLVRRMHVTDSLLQLQVVRKKSARMLARVIWRARANAVHNHGMDPDKLVIAQVSASVGPNREKEIDYKSKARYGMIVRGRAHIFVRLQEVEGARPFTQIKFPKLWRERLERERAAVRAIESFA